MRQATTLKLPELPQQHTPRPIKKATCHTHCSPDYCGWCGEDPAACPCRCTTCSGVMHPHNAEGDCACTHPTPDPDEPHERQDLDAYQL